MIFIPSPCVHKDQTWSGDKQIAEEINKSQPSGGGGGEGIAPLIETVAKAFYTRGQSSFTLQGFSAAV